MTLHQAVREVADRRPEACAIEETGGPSVSYRELVALADRLAGGLAVRGVGAGDCVGFALRNSIEYVALILATASLGAHYVPLLSGFGEQEVKEALRLTRPVLLVADREVPAQVPAVPLDRLLSGHPTAEADRPREGRTPAPGVFRILWSSGSTGFPKGIAWRQDRFVTERRRWIADTEIDDTDVVFCRHPLDVAHATDLHVFAALLSGARLVLADPAAPPRVLLRQLAQYRATVTSALPWHYEELIAAAEPGRGPDLSGLRRALCGGAYLSPAVSLRAREVLGITVREIYGSTEFGLALGDMSGEGLAPVAGVGTRIEALPGSAGTGCTDTGCTETGCTETGCTETGCADTGCADTGELVLRSDCTSEGYLENPAANARTFRAAEFWTGDMARRLPDGRLRILGRLTDALATPAGPLLAPMLDEELAATGAVAETVSLPVHPQGYRNEVLVAVRPARAEPAARAAAIAAVTAVLNRHHLHGTVEFVDAVPRTEVGKVNKPLLRERWGMR
ncbi:class I adenylate-forming enzyme family protein [Kitasatospora sp. NBC_01266]|uniref:class I adenylate-forming enzyme family protein n=1 Tax=Kitasatospora sp. NBC_01266 TaxID=2903572 RepID=UPI002E37AFFF|nr:AMP-binding protein [Kitasatospora sp. NBC_01266]